MVTSESTAVLVDRERLGMLLLFSVRYAMGRGTCAPIDATEAVRIHGDILPAWVLEQFVRDIERDAAHGMLGEWNATVWAEFADWCRSTLEVRRAR